MRLVISDSNRILAEALILAAAIAPHSDSGCRSAGILEKNESPEFRRCLGG